MSLHIEKVELREFRGYDYLELGGLSDLVILVGHNAVGKTNIIEGIQLMTTGTSFRRPRWDEVISWGAQKARLSMLSTKDKRVIENVLLVEDGKRLYEVNGKKRPASAIKGLLPSVLFIPDDLQMIKAASSTRRAAIDELGTQLSRNYLTLRNDYAQTLRQRNLLMKEEVTTGPLLESWNESLVINGSRLLINRVRLFKRLRGLMQDIYSQIVPGEQLEVFYIPSWQRFDKDGHQVTDTIEARDVTNFDGEGIEETTAFFEKGIRDLAETERRRRTSLVGPHKDEIAFYIDGKNARLFASQGQQRTIVLVWKLAEVELINEITGNQPVLLLDDVMSELDEAHRAMLTNFIKDDVQTFITTTNPDYFSQDLMSQAQVIGLPIQGSKHVY